MPAWMQAVAADPKHAGEAQQLWQEHQALRETALEVNSLRQSAASMQEAAQSVERIDAAIFSGDARAQSEVVAEMARANPAAFRSMFAEAAKVLAGMGAGGREQGKGQVELVEVIWRQGPPCENREGWGTQPNSKPESGSDSNTGVRMCGRARVRIKFKTNQNQIQCQGQQSTSHRSPFRAERAGGRPVNDLRSCCVCIF